MRSVSMDGASVEWLFGDVINYSEFLDFIKNLKIGQVLLEKCTPFALFCKIHTQFCMGTQL